MDDPFPLFRPERWHPPRAPDRFLPFFRRFCRLSACGRSHAFSFCLIRKERRPSPVAPRAPGERTRLPGSREREVALYPLYPHISPSVEKGFPFFCSFRFRLLWGIVEGASPLSVPFPSYSAWDKTRAPLPFFCFEKKFPLSLLAVGRRWISSPSPL